MKTRYQAFYQSIPSLGRPEADLTETDGPVRPARTGPEHIVRQPSVLEALHPEIVQAVTLLWGYPELNVYFEKLWLDDGSGAPIAPEAMSELMLLAGVHRWLTPPRPVRTMASIYDACSAPNLPKDVWNDIPSRRR